MPDDIIPEMIEAVADAIDRSFVSLSENCSKGGRANAVDGLFAVARALDRVARAIESLQKISVQQI